MAVVRDLTSTRPAGRRRLAIPPQHGAWAYLAIPLVLGLWLVGWSWLGGLFAVTWVIAYPASYYLARAAVTRWRRGSWTRIARRERSDAVPWAAAASVGAGMLVLARPWLVVWGAVLAACWAVGVALAHAGRERGFANDLLLVGQSLVALPLLSMITQDTSRVSAVPTSVWQATGVCAVYFVGSVIHVKSLIRESGDRRWHVANIAYHAAALGLGLWSAWLLVPFTAALLRSLLLTPRARPGVIGAVESGVSVLVVVFTALAVG